jgi:hypothetical protein
MLQYTLLLIVVGYTFRTMTCHSGSSVACHNHLQLMVRRARSFGPANQDLQRFLLRAYRITVPEIRARPWYLRPPLYAQATGAIMHAPTLLPLLLQLPLPATAAICRITVPEIRAHPWYSRPLPPLYAQATGAIMQEQARIDQQVRVLQQQRQQGKALQVRCGAGHCCCCCGCCILDVGHAVTPCHHQDAMALQLHLLLLLSPAAKSIQLQCRTSSCFSRCTQSTLFQNAMPQNLTTLHLPLMLQCCRLRREPLSTKIVMAR